MDSRAIINGVKQMQAKLELAANNLIRAQALALRQEAEIEMTESKKRCPVDVGTLRASGHVVGPTLEGKKMHVDLVYGGAAEDYAIVQHEELGYFHKVGQAKYLESVLMESLPYMGARVAARIKENMK